MNTLSDDGGWIGDDLLAELASQSVQDAVLGFQYPRLVLSHTSLDEVEAFDHHAPEARRVWLVFAQGPCSPPSRRAVPPCAGKSRRARRICCGPRHGPSHKISGRLGCGAV